MPADREATLIASMASYFGISVDTDDETDEEEPQAEAEPSASETASAGTAEAKPSASETANPDTLHQKLYGQGQYAARIPSKPAPTALGCAVIDLIHEPATIRSLRVHRATEPVSAEEWLNAMALEEPPEETLTPAFDASEEAALLTISAVGTEAWKPTFS
jgi:hypothetical protein